MHLFTKIAGNVWENFDNYDCNNFMHLILAIFYGQYKIDFEVHFKGNACACKNSEHRLQNMNWYPIYLISNEIKIANFVILCCFCLNLLNHHILYLVWY